MNWSKKSNQKTTRPGQKKCTIFFVWKPFFSSQRFQKWGPKFGPHFWHPQLSFYLKGGIFGTNFWAQKWNWGWFHFPYTNSSIFLRFWSCFPGFVFAVAFFRISSAVKHDLRERLPTCKCHFARNAFNHVSLRFVFINWSKFWIISGQCGPPLFVCCILEQWFRQAIRYLS